MKNRILTLGLSLLIAGCSMQQIAKPTHDYLPQKPEIKKEDPRKLKELEWLYKYRHIERPGVYDDNPYV